MYEQILSSKIDPATDWEIRQVKCFDNSILPLYKRVMGTLDLAVKYNGWQWALRQLWCDFWYGPDDDHCCAHSGWDPEYLAEHPEKDFSLPVGFRAETLDDARKMAIAFADSVG